MQVEPCTIGWTMERNPWTKLVLAALDMARASTAPPPKIIQHSALDFQRPTRAPARAVRSPSSDRVSGTMRTRGATRTTSPSGAAARAYRRRISVISSAIKPTYGFAQESSAVGLHWT